MLPRNQPLLKAYLACATQWRYAGSGFRVGMDYPGVDAALRLRFPQDSPGRRRRQFAAIQTIERALLAAQGERWEAEQGKAR